MGQYLDYLYATSQSGSYSLHHDSSRTVPTIAAPAPRPPQATDGLSTGAIHCTMVLVAPSGSKEQGRSETDDECLPPHSADIFAGSNRPMCRAMEWCGRTTSSFVKFPAECSCIWAECKCGHSKNAESDSVQTEAFNRGLQPDEQSVLLVQDDLVAFVKRSPENHPRSR